MGVYIKESQRVTVSGVTAKDCWGDGFYVTKGSRVTLRSVAASGNRRDGASVVDGSDIEVMDSSFTDSQAAGLDIEPNAGQTVDTVLVSGCLFSGNAGAGLSVSVPVAHKGVSFTRHVTIRNNILTRNGTAGAPPPQVALLVSNCGGQTITGNVIADNAGMGIYLWDNVSQALVADNTVYRNQGDGICQLGGADNTITRNIVLDNEGHGICATRSSGGTVSGNQVSGNGQTP